MKKKVIDGAMSTTAGQFIANYSPAFVRTYIKQYIWRHIPAKKVKHCQLHGEISLHICKCALICLF